MTIRKAIPLLWRYLLVVATSCLLALVISNAHADARVAQDFALAGPFAVDTIDANWRDEARKRDVPVQIHVPKVATDNKFPVVLFSHGLGGSRAGGQNWGEHWASHGYVVVHLQHAGSDEALWKGKAPAEAVRSMKAGMTIQNLLSRVQDVHFVIDEVVRRADARQGIFAFADGTRIGMSGHSFGAQTTMSVVGQSSPIQRGQPGLDKRIVAGMAFSPNARNKARLDQQFGDIRMPVMSLTGSRDGSILEDNTVYQDRILPYQHMPAGDKYLLVFDGGDHMVFGGHVLGGRRPETARDREIQRHVKAATTAFWDATLKGNAQARQWLREEFKLTLLSADTFEWK